MKILLIGSGPDRPGKAGALDRLAVQARRWLLAQGHELVWLDSNPSAIMSRPVKGCRVYLEPLELGTLNRLIERERPQALMYDFGGRLSQHLALFLEREGVLDRFQVKVLGMPMHGLRDFLDEEALYGIMQRLGLPVVKTAVGRSYQEGLSLTDKLGFPLLMKPALDLEDMGGRWLFNRDEAANNIWPILHASPVGEFIVQKLPLGWSLAGVESLHGANSPGSTRLLGTWEPVDGKVGTHPGNLALRSPAQILDPELCARVLRWSDSLAANTGLRGSLCLELGLAPEGGQVRVLRARAGLSPLGAWLALINRVPLGQLAAGLALGLPWEEMTAAPTSFQTGLRLPRDFKPEGSAPVPEPILRARGAEVRVVSSTQSAAPTEAFHQDYGKGQAFPLGRRNSDWLLILGPGPYSQGWGPEVDLALWHTAHRLKQLGKHLVLLNNNPDAASLDYALFDEIYLAETSVTAVASALDRWPIGGVIHQFCPKVPSELTALLPSRGVELLGTPLTERALLTDWGQACRLLSRLGLPLRRHCLVDQAGKAVEKAGLMGYPVLARLTDGWLNPAGEVLYSARELAAWLHTWAEHINPATPLYLEDFQEKMVGAQVLGLADCQGARCLGLVENIEAYGVHSGDCAATLTPISLQEDVRDSALGFLQTITRHCKLVGHLKLELAIASQRCWITGISPFPSQHLPLVENALGYDPHALAARVLGGGRLPNGQSETRPRGHVIKEAVFPSQFISGQDPVLSPCMRSIGQVLGRDKTLGKAFYKSQLAVNPELPRKGCVFVSVRDDEKEALLKICQKLHHLDFQLMSTQGTAHFLRAHNLRVREVFKLCEGRPNVIDMIKNNEVCLAINIPGGLASKQDEATIRLAAVERNLPLYTTIAGALLMVQGMEESRRCPLDLSPLEMVGQG